MPISPTPSKFTLPQVNPGVATVLEYLLIKFPRIDAEVWRQRMREGKVHWHDGELIRADTPYREQQRVYYYREVAAEPKISFQESIIYRDEHILVAFKPHFLALMPGGIFVNECLQSRLRESTGLPDLQALHRLDRVTAGVVMFSINPDTRHAYHELFASRNIHKTYQAVAHVGSDEIAGREWLVKNRMANGEPKFKMQIVDGEPNSHSVIRCVQQQGEKALFELHPVTGRTHQLRLHMASLGFGILHDKYYPELQDKSADNFDQPLQLLAKSLDFVDPITGHSRHFSCSEQLSHFTYL